MRINENLWNTMKVLRRQEASLELSKVFYRGSRSSHTVQSIHDLKSMKIYKNQWKSLEIHKKTMKMHMRRKSSEDKKPTSRFKNGSPYYFWPFWQLQNFNQMLHFGPFTYGRNTFKNVRKHKFISNTYYFCKFENFGMSAYPYLGNLLK